MPLSFSFRKCGSTLALVAVLACASGASGEARQYLREDWEIQSSCKVSERGEQVATRAVRPQGWIRATVPTTVLAAQVAAGVFKDPYFGMNLREIPGTTYPIGRMFATLPMDPSSPYACPWWYRTEFTVPPGYRGKQVWLHFDGINYRANVWLNGKQIASSNDLAGMWREWEFNVTDKLAAGTNVLAVQVYAQKENELGITFVDWNPMPPDKDMGLYRPVYLTASGPVAVRHGFVSAKLDGDLKRARLSATVELTNVSSEIVRGRARYTVPLDDADLYWKEHPEEFQQQKQRDIVASQERREKPTYTDDLRLGVGGIAEDLVIGPGETKVVNFPEVQIDAPRIWWPYGMGNQERYEAKFDFFQQRDRDPKSATGRPGLTDDQTVTFAIRSVTSELTPQGYRLFKVNGKNFLVRGGGWTPDMMLRQDPMRLQAELNYVRDMNLNTVRLEGKLETDEFFELADRMGIMVMAGWCCCDFWEKWGQWQPGDVDVAAASLADQIRRLRNHPSLLVWLNGSDNPPPADVELRYVSVLEQYGWPNPYISSATATASALTEASGVKMSGPYDFVPPNYWTLDTYQYGGGYGFNTETSPGPAIPPTENMKKILPPEHLWPVDDWWNYHAGAGTFKQFDIYNAALTGRYGASGSLEQFTVKSQAAAYDGERAMFEAYTRNRYRSTGVIQWMLNNAWPSVIWHLYDYFLTPAGGYFGAKKACEPLHVLYGYDDRSVVVSNSTQAPTAGLRVRARVLNFDMSEKFAREAAVDAGPDSVVKALDIPALDGLSTTYFLDLRLTDAAGREVSRNFYWLSTRNDELDWPQSKYFYTPQTQFADLTQLDSLPPVKLAVTRGAMLHGGGGRNALPVTVKNPTSSLAFMVRLRVTNGRDGDDILPVRWQDNYFPLLPGESRTVLAEFDAGALTGKTPVVRVEGWNVVAAAETRTPAPAAPRKNPS